MPELFLFDGRALPLSAWPKIDRDAWAAAQLSADGLLDKDGPAAEWRPSTKEQHCRCYGFWLAWLGTEGHLNPDVRPEERVTTARIAAYLKADRALGNGPRTLVNHAVGLRHMFEALAPHEDWSWMLPMIYKLKNTVKLVKNHSDLPSIRELFEIGMAIMRKVPNLNHGTPKQHAIWFRNGLAIALLAARPLMRRNNLATIKIGTNLLKEGQDFALSFTNDEMKGRTRRGGPVPEVLTPFIERYIHYYRQRLLIGKSGEHNVFFISGMGNPITPTTCQTRSARSFFLAGQASNNPRFSSRGRQFDLKGRP